MQMDDSVDIGPDAGRSRSAATPRSWGAWPSSRSPRRARREVSTRANDETRLRDLPPEPG